MEISGADTALACRLWGAMGRSSSSTAKQLRWFFERIEQRPLEAIVDQMTGLQQRYSPQAWIAMLEALVAQELLTRHQANTITEHLLTWAGAAGAWKYC